MNITLEQLKRLVIRYDLTFGEWPGVVLGTERTFPQRCAFCGQVFDWKDGMVGAICEKCSEEHGDESQ